MFANVTRSNPYLFLERENGCLPSQIPQVDNAHGMPRPSDGDSCDSSWPASRIDERFIRIPVAGLGCRIVPDDRYVHDSGEYWIRRWNDAKRWGTTWTGREGGARRLARSRMHSDLRQRWRLNWFRGVTWFHAYPVPMSRVQPKRRGGRGSRVISTTRRIDSGR